MGMKATEALEVSFEDLPNYLRANHAVYMDVDGKTYYITDCNDGYWRVQDTDKLNEKNHYVDCSELVYLVHEFIALPFADGKSIADLFDQATFYPSVKAE